MLTIGGAQRGTEHELFRVSGGTVLEDGTVVVSNGGTQELRYFDSSGTYLTSGGREGEGPGEFSSLSLVGPFNGDSILAWDQRQRRFSVFGPNGVFARSFRLPGTLMIGATPVGVLSDGRPVVRTIELGVADPTATSGIERRPSTFSVLDPSGQVEVEVGPFPGSEVSLVFGASGASAFPVVLGRGLHATARGTSIAVGTDDEYSIRTYTGDGSLLRVVRQMRDPLPVQPGDFDRATPLPNRPSSPPSPMKARFEANFAQMPRHSTFPAFGSSTPRSSLRLDQAGNLWVQEYLPPWGEGTSWQIFDSEGSLLGRLDLAEGITWLDAGSDWILTRVTDDLGVESVVLYQLEATSDESR